MGQRKKSCLRYLYSMNIGGKRKRPSFTRGRDHYYQSMEWKALRKEIRGRDKGICQMCKRRGHLHFAGKYSVVDHIIPRKTTNLALAPKPDWITEVEFMELKQKIMECGFDIVENLELICKAEHDRKSAFEKKR